MYALIQVKRLELEDQRVRLHVMDTAGQERFDALSYKYYRGANGVMLVYDITTRKSFDDITMWLENIRKHCHQDIHAVLVGNKCDLLAEREVSRQEGDVPAVEAIEGNGRARPEEPRGMGHRIGSDVSGVSIEGPSELTVGPEGRATPAAPRW